MLRLGKTFSLCGTYPTPRSTSAWAGEVGYVVTAEPHLPERTGTSPNIALSSVDLPAPFGPMTPTISPRREREAAPGQDVDTGQVAGDDRLGLDQQRGATRSRLTALRVPGTQVGLDHRVVGSSRPTEAPPLSRAPRPCRRPSR